MASEHMPQDVSITKDAMAFTTSVQDAHGLQTQSQNCSTNAAEPGYEALSMEGIARANLPFDIKLKILKEYIRSWATRIPRLQGSLEHFPQTSRAYLIYFEGSSSSTWASEFVGGKYVPREKVEYGWCAIPIVPNPLNTSNEDDAYRRAPDDPMRQLRHHRDRLGDRDAPRPPDEMRIARILEVCSSSKDFEPYLRTFFFAHMTWELRAVVDASRIPRLIQPPVRFTPIKKISMRLYTLTESRGIWVVFCDLLKEVYIAVTETETLNKLQSVEIFIDLPLLVKLLPQTSCAWSREWCRGWWHPLPREKLSARIRYLVTLCYLMVRAKPDLTICVRGICSSRSNEDAWREDPEDFDFFEEEDENETGEMNDDNHDITGFSGSQIRKFRKSDSVFLQGLKSIEFAHVIEGPFTIPEITWDDYYWQMSFALEWRKIWDQGCEVAENDGGYTAVYDPAVTY